MAGLRSNVRNCYVLCHLSHHLGILPPRLGMQPPQAAGTLRPLMSRPAVGRDASLLERAGSSILEIKSWRRPNSDDDRRCRCATGTRFRSRRIELCRKRDDHCQTGEVPSMVNGLQHVPNHPHLRHLRSDKIGLIRSLIEDGKLHRKTHYCDVSAKSFNR